MDFVASAIRAAFGWSCDHGCSFTIKRREYGTHNHWVRFDPEQEFDRSEREIHRQHLGPRQSQKAKRALLDWYEALPKPDEAEEDAIPLLGELVRRAGAKFSFLYDFGDCWRHTVRVEKIVPASPGMCAAQLFPRW